MSLAYISDFPFVSLNLHPLFRFPFLFLLCVCVPFRFRSRRCRRCRCCRRRLRRPPQFSLFLISVHPYCFNPLILFSLFYCLLQSPLFSHFSRHSPYKQAAGSRLARGALATVYGMPQPYPTVASIALSGKSVKLVVAGLGNASSAGIQIRQPFGFEILGSDSLWHTATIDTEASAGNAVVFGPAPVGAMAVRYLWGTSSAPCGNAEPYNCAVNAKVPALPGALSGEFAFLPLGPFVKAL